MFDRCSSIFRSYRTCVILLSLYLVFLTGCQGDGDAEVHDRDSTGDSSAVLRPSVATEPFVLVLGIGQDGGVPQAGRVHDSRWHDAAQKRMVASIGIVDPVSATYWILDATPNLPEQLTMVAGAVPDDTLEIGGVFLTHAHIGHYTGLMYFGHEAMGANLVPIYVMPKMRTFLESNGPWDQLVRYRNIDLRTLDAGVPVRLSANVSVTPIVVPHRQEYSETVGYRVTGPRKSIVFIPDIDSWSQLDDTGASIESIIAESDYAFLDGTFFANGELPGRDMSGFPHPFISKSIERFGSLDESERNKVHFIHLNHSNAALYSNTSQAAEVQESGMHIASEGMRVEL